MISKIFPETDLPCEVATRTCRRISEDRLEKGNFDSGRATSKIFFKNLLNLLRRSHQEVGRLFNPVNNYVQFLMLDDETDKTGLKKDCWH
jgi:hypothetical protein